MNLSSLNGYRTYITAGVLIFVAGLHALSIIDDKTYDVLFGLLGGTGLALLRAGVTNESVATRETVITKTLPPAEKTPQ
jgi:hypothetical protein